MKLNTAEIESREVWIDDPPPTTPYDVVDESGLLRLRHYEPDDRPAPPVLLVYSLFKRPYILDLMPERSVVRSFLRQGFSVYLTDWLPPGLGDAERGFHSYVNRDLARAVDCVRAREGVEQVPLVGCCLGGLLSVVYAALHAESVRHLVALALPFDVRPKIAPSAVEYMASLSGNVPAWLIHAGFSAGVPPEPELPLYFARELGEPELAHSADGARSSVQRALQPWMDSDVPLAGRVFREVMRDAIWDARLAENRLCVDDQCVDLEHIRCPVLNVIGERDRLVPPKSATALVERVGSCEARNLVFPTGHLGLFVSLAAHRELWPRVGAWLRDSPVY